MPEVLKAPMPYYGGKSRAAPLIWEALGDPDNYVEPFCGSLAVLLGRPTPPQLETVNDACGFIANVWRAIQADPDAVAHYADRPSNECLPAGTLIATPDGEVPIEQLRPGMLVYGERNGEVIPTQVIATTSTDTMELYRIGPVWMTGNHPVWTQEAGYCPARELTPGMSVALLDILTNKLDLDMLQLDHEQPSLGNLYLKRSTHHSSPLCGRNIPAQSQDERTYVQGYPGRQYLSRSLDTVTDCPWSPSSLSGNSRGAGRWMAGSRTSVDSLLSSLYHPGQLHRWWGRIAGVCPDTRTPGEMVSHASWSPLCPRPCCSDAGQTPYAGGTRENPCNQYRTAPYANVTGQTLGGAYRQDTYPRTSGETVSSQERQAPLRRIQAQHGACTHRAQACAVHRNTGSLPFYSCCNTGPEGPQVEYSSGYSQRMPLPGLSLAIPLPVYNFQTVTGNYFANRLLVHNCDLHAIHSWLVAQRSPLTARLEGDMDYYDAKVAGLWLWGICCWIGSGWCAGTGSWHVVDGQLTHLGDAGRGVQRKRQALSDKGGGMGVHALTARTDGLTTWMRALCDRLRYVRVTCGDWTRVLGPSVTWKHGTTGIVLDPPYSHSERTKDLYAVEADIAPAVQAWCLANGGNPLLRIVLCGYESEYTLPGWRVVPWKATAGYSGQNQARDNHNSERETLWCSPHCLAPQQLALFGGA